MKNLNKFKTSSFIINLSTTLINELKLHLRGFKENEVVLTYYSVSSDRWAMYLARHYNLESYVYFYIDHVKCYLEKSHLDSIKEGTALVKDGVVSKFIETDLPCRSFEIIYEEI